jgi:asparagine synthase (glutamine-hydrolysing)
MCGVAGWFARDGLTEAEGRALLDALGDALVHRGPDGRGHHLSRHVGLVSTRLAIIDPTHGHMPVVDGDVAAILNGELYGYARVQQALRAEGVRLVHGSDTALIPPLYRRHGLTFVEQLDGMFAIALADDARRRLVLARDRLGMKPLFHARPRPGLVVFASEAKALLASGLVPARVATDALRSLFSAGYVLPPGSMFEGIAQLPPGHLWVLEGDGEAAPTRYFLMPYARDGDALGAAAPARALEADGVPALGAALDAAVRDHLVADVEVGSYLSGGLDSGLVAALAQRALAPSRTLRTFSMTFPEALRFDESPEARETARFVGVDHTELPQAPIDADDYVATLRALEAPQVHTVGYCLYRLARAARAAGPKVVLSGEGSDELFAGYAVFKLGRLRRSPLGRLMALRRAIVRLALGRRAPTLAAQLDGWWRVEPALVERYGLVPPWIEQWWILAEAMRGLMTPDALARLDHGARGPLDHLPALDAVADTCRGVAAPLHRELAFEQATRLDGWVLPLGDRLSMASGLELRVPMLDPRVLDVAARLPPSSLLRGLREKHALRRVADGLVPPSLVRRRKRSFVAPSADWFFTAPPPGIAPLVEDALSPEAVRARGLFAPEAVAAARATIAAGTPGYPRLVATWSLQLALSTEVFCRTFRASW